MRGTSSNKAYEFLRQGAKCMTYPCWDAGDLQAAYHCFANAAIEDHQPGWVKNNPAKRYDNKAFERAQKADSGYWRAYSWLAYCLLAAYQENVRKRVSDVPFGNLRMAKAFAEKAERLCRDRDDANEPTDYVVPWVIGHYHVVAGDDKSRGLAYYERAVALNGDNNMNLQAEYGEALIALGRYDDAVRAIARAGRGKPWYTVDLAWAYYHKGSEDPYFYCRALEELASIDVTPGDREYPADGLLIEALASAQLGDAARARRAVTLFRAVKPSWKISHERVTTSHLESHVQTHWVDGCKKARL